MKCPGCGADASGAFCSNCGTRLTADRSCARCGSALPANARFCVQCGARAGTDRRWLRYAIPAGIAALALLAGYWLGERGGDPAASRSATPDAPFATQSGARGAPPPLTGSMREQADRLFERIMQARARGDTAEASFFLPMALQAYEGAGPLDADGLFHLGLLQLEGGRAAEASATAERIADADASHLFGFALEAEAAMARGDQAAARAAFTRFLAEFDSEIGRDIPEYEMHRPALDEYRQQARDLTGG